MPEGYPPTLPSLEHDSIRTLMGTLGLPQPSSIASLDSTGEYHSIYMLSFNEDVRATAGTSLPATATYGLVLRASGRHIPQRKTRNEVAIMQWLRIHTGIPIADVVAFDASEDNPIGCEFTLLTRVPGVCAANIYDELSREKKDHLVRQLAGFIAELHRQPFNHVGGLAIDERGNVVPGPIVEVRSWQGPEIHEAWGATEDVESLNARGPFDSWVDYSIAKLHKCQYALEKHALLAQPKERLGDRVTLLIAALATARADMDSTTYVLAHKDMHFSNIMCDADTCDITGVLDWEFSQVAPLPLWDPGNFLLSINSGDSMRKEQETMLKVFRDECRKLGIAQLVSSERTGLQEAMAEAVENLSAILRAVALQRHQDWVPLWWQGLEEALKEFDVA